MTRLRDYGQWTSSEMLKQMRSEYIEATKRADALAAESARLRVAIKSALDWIEQGETFKAEEVLTEAMR